MSDWRLKRIYDPAGTPAETKRLYQVWFNMFDRCYNEKRSRIAYAGCTVDPRFYRYSDFISWALAQTGSMSPGFEIDKDILVKGNFVYGPETCCFVPREINSSLIKCFQSRNGMPLGVRSRPKNRLRPFYAEISKNQKNIHIGSFSTVEQAFYAYKTAKEAAIKELADKYRGAIAERVYDALSKYSIEITD